MNETKPRTTKRITEYPLAMLGAGALLGWLAHEFYVAYKLAEMGLL